MKRPITLSVEALDPQLTGVGRYVWELARRLPTQSGVGKIRFLRNGEWFPDPARLLVDPSPKKRPKHIRWLRKRTKPLLRLRDDLLGRFSICHGPNFFLPDIAEKGVITVHDLSVFRYPETHPAARREHFERDFAHTLARTTHIITVSETIRQEVMAFTGFSADKVTTVYQGVGPSFQPRDADILTPALTPYGLTSGGYALCVSTIEPRKRIGELLQAWRQLPLAVRSRWPLVLAGSSGWLSEGILREMAQAEREGWLHYVRYVPEQDLPLLYAGAALFVYPSIYEGFGLPPIEAMASGIPTVVADASCLPEVTSGAAMLVQPEDVDGFARHLEQALTDAPWRAQARAAGLVVAGGYSWDRCVRETVDVYRRLD